MHHAPSEKFFSRLESVLFRTLFYPCRALDKFSRSDHAKMTNLWLTNADYGLTPGGWILIYTLSLVLLGCVIRGSLKVTGSSPHSVEIAIAPI